MTVVSFRHGGCLGVEGGDPPSTSPSDGVGTPGAAGEEEDDDIDEDWGEI